MKSIRFLFDKDTLEKFSTHTILAGILMLVVGAIGIIVPVQMSMVVIALLGWLFIVSAFIQGYITYKTYRGSFSAWLKPILSLVSGILLFVFPIEGVAVLAVMLSAYLMIDAFSSIGFGLDYRPNRWWWVHIINALISIVLAVLIMVGWPVSSLFWVGLYAAISLFFDGVALVSMGIVAKKATKV